MKAIEALSLTKYYGSSRGIIDVDLTVREGDFYGFIGPNGAGKSTFIRTILGLIGATSGSAKIFGRDIAREKISNLRDIGYLPSEAILYGNMTAPELLRYSASLRGIDCTGEATRLCERLNVDTTKKIDELSLGNRKKVGIVAALQHNPRLLILDEPTSGLDPLMQNEFYQILHERNREGATVFLSSHVLSEVGKHCGFAAVIREGRILLSDSVENLRAQDAKRVRVRGIADISFIPEATDITLENGTTSFLYSGDINTLVKILSSRKLIDLNITDPELDEIFLHYYEREGK